MSAVYCDKCMAPGSPNDDKGYYSPGGGWLCEKHRGDVWMCLTCFDGFLDVPITRNEHGEPTCPACLERHFEELLAGINAAYCKKLFRTRVTE